MKLTPVAQQWKRLVIEPVLAELGSKYASLAAVHLLLGTAAVESGFMMLAQWPKGSARGYYQIEPATARDILDRAPDGNTLHSFGSSHATVEEDLIWNLAFQTVIARMKYWLIPEPLPRANDIVGLAAYWKEYYQAGGKKGLPLVVFIDVWEDIVERK